MYEKIKTTGLATARCYHHSDVSQEGSHKIVQAFPKKPVRYIMILGSNEEVKQFSKDADGFPDGFRQHI